MFTNITCSERKPVYPFPFSRTSFLHPSFTLATFPLSLGALCERRRERGGVGGSDHHAPRPHQPHLSVGDHPQHRRVQRLDRTDKAEESVRHLHQQATRATTALSAARRGGLQTHAGRRRIPTRYSTVTGGRQLNQLLSPIHFVSLTNDPSHNNTITILLCSPPSLPSSCGGCGYSARER